MSKIYDGHELPLGRHKMIKFNFNYLKYSEGTQ